jgi:DNA repair protein SbcD/Mre11
MRILHTSDWHLGVTFEGISREEDHKFFLKWLIQTLCENKIDVFIIAGDIFDQAQPSADAQKIYYQFLFQVSQKTSVKRVIVLGGNHDSPSRLDAPSELLKLLDVFVVGGISSDLSSMSRYLCPVYNNKDNKVELVVAVVPFIHEYRLGVRTAFQTENEIQQSFKEKLSNLYSNLADEAEKISNGAPLIATGHLACVGCENDDFPLEVHMVGTLGGLPKDIFDPRFSYIALGHIHRSYRVENSNAYYCGSPIPLSIKESNSPRYVQFVSFQNLPKGEPIISKIVVPLRRKILEIKGNIDEIYDQIKNLIWETIEPPILCVQVIVDIYMAGIDLEIRKKINHYFPNKSPILASVRQNPKMASDRFITNHEMISLKDLTSEQVFLKMCESQNQIVDDELIKAFRSLLNEENI